jgi:hypothetical protein
MKIKALVLSKGNLEEQNIDNTLEELQKIVGGYIEIPYLSKSFKEYGIDIIINDEGKYIEGLTPEIAVVGKETNAVLDVVYGNCVFVSHDTQGNTVGLSNEQIEVVTEELELSAMLNDSKDEKDYLVKVLLV